MDAAGWGRLQTSVAWDAGELAVGASCNACDADSGGQEGAPHSGKTARTGPCWSAAVRADGPAPGTCGPDCRARSNVFCSPCQTKQCKPL